VAVVFIVGGVVVGVRVVRVVVGGGGRGEKALGILLVGEPVIHAADDAGIDVRGVVGVVRVIKGRGGRGERGAHDAVGEDHRAADGGQAPEDVREGVEVGEVLGEFLAGGADVGGRAGEDADELGFERLDGGQEVGEVLEAGRVHFCFTAESAESAEKRMLSRKGAKVAEVAERAERAKGKSGGGVGRPAGGVIWWSGGRAVRAGGSGHGNQGSAGAGFGAIPLGTLGGT
jgi:hypothetical protein